MQIKAEMGDNNQFSFNAILRAVEEDGIKYLEGVASSTSKDQHGTIFSEDCQDGFKSDISENNVVIDIKHSDNFMDFIGKAESADVIQESDITKLVVRIKLNNNNPQATQLFNIIREPNIEMGEPESLGMSIMGTAKKWHINSEGITIFDRVVLERIAITDSPSNTDTFINVIKRSIINKEEILVSETKESTEVVVEEVQREVEIAPQEEPQVAEIKAEETVEVKRALDYTDDWKITAMSVRESVAEYVNKMVNAITAVQASDLTADMLLLAVKEFVDHYEDKLEDMMWSVEWAGIAEEQVAREKSLVKQLKSKNNLSERINIKVIEREKMQEQEKAESVVEAQVETQVAQSSSEGDVVREILEAMMNLREEIKSLKDQNEKVERELGEIKNKPTATQVLPSEVVTRENKPQLTKDQMLAKFIYG